MRRTAGICVILVMCGTITPGCACASSEMPAFSAAQLEWGSEVLGPDIGDIVPDLGLPHSARQRSTLVLTPGFLPTEAMPFLRGWATQTGSQLVLVDADLSVEHATLGSSVTYIEQADARAALTLLRVGSAACPLLLLLDETRRVVYREETMGADARILRTDSVVVSFADGGIVNPSAVLHHVLTAGEVIPWPTFPLLDAAGGPVAVGPGRPRLILRSSYYPAEAELPLLPAGIDALRAEFPGVEFVWLVPEMSTESFGTEWDYGQLRGWSIDFPDRYGVSRSEFVTARSSAAAEWLQATLAGLAQQLPTWSVWVDVDGALEDYWSIPPMSSLAVLAADGRAVLPPSPYPMLEDPDTGERTPDPRAVDELRILLREVTL